MNASGRSETIPIRSEADIVMVRQRARALTTELRFSLVDQTKMVTAASELARNTLIHGMGGASTLELVNDGRGRAGLRIVFEDTGPGIPDIARAMTDGYTTGKGLGLGLSGAKRLVTDFTIETRVGEGTRISITRWK